MFASNHSRPVALLGRIVLLLAVAFGNVAPAAAAALPALPQWPEGGVTQRVTSDPLPTQAEPAAPPADEPERQPESGPAAVNVSATMVDSLQTDVDGDTKADPGDTLRYTIVVNNSGTTDATGVSVGATLDTNTTAVANSVKSTPLARNDSYAVLGNVSIAPAAASGLLANDNDPDGGAITVVPGTPTSVQGGNVTLNADGSFTYNPPRGYEGSDSFTYTAQDADGNTNTATVSLTISGMIWFIDNSAAACAAAVCGRLSNPYNSLAAFNTANDGTANNPAAGDSIFLYQRATGYTGPLTLLNNQKLFGQDATAPLPTLTGLTPPAHSATLPTMNSGDATYSMIVNGSGNGVIVAGGGNVIAGLRFGNVSGDAISGTGAGNPALSINEVSINTTGRALNLTGYNATITLSGLTSSGGVHNVLLTNMAGTIDLGSGALSGSTTAALAMSGGNATVSYAGTIGVGTNSHPVQVSGKTGGTVTLSGAITSSQRGVSLSSNGGTTFVFSGGLTLNTGANTAFSATGGGTVNVTGSTNTIQTTSGIGLNVVNTTIGSSGLTFRSINTNGASSGIVLDNTGTQAGLTVTGTGSSNSGGTIQNSTSDGIKLANTQAINLTEMRVVGSTDNNVDATSVVNLTLDSFACESSGSDGFLGNTVRDLTIRNGSLFANNGNEATENGIEIINLLGNSSVKNTTFSLSAVLQMKVQNNAAFGNPDILTISGTSWTAGGALFGDQLSVESLGSGNLRVVVDNLSGANTFTGGISGVYIATGTNGRLDGRISSVTTGSTTGPGINVSGNGTGSTLTFNVSGNTTNNPGNVGINITSNTGSTVNGRAENNAINNPPSNGMQVILEGDGAMTVLLKSNNIQGSIAANGIRNQARAGTGTLNLTLDSNIVNNTNAASAPTHGILVQAGSSAGTETNTVCLNMFSNNSSTASAAAGTRSYRLVQSAGTTFRLQNFTGNGTVVADVQTWVATTKSNTGNKPPASVLIGGTGFTTTPACATPSLMAEPTALDSETPTATGPQAAEALEAPSAEVVAEPVAQVVPAAAAAAPAAARAAAPTADLPLVIGTLPAGKSVTIIFDVVIANPVPAGVTQVSNQASISGSNFTTVLTDDPSIGTANDPTVTLLNVETDLQLTKAVVPAGVVIPGRQVTYTLSYTNTGSQHAASVTVTDLLNAALTNIVVSGTPAPTLNSTNPHVWSVGNLAPGASGFIQIVATLDPAVTAGATIPNTATIGSTTTDPLSTNNSGNASFTTSTNKRCGIGVGVTYGFKPSANEVNMRFNSNGTIHCVSVNHTPSAHPNAYSSIGNIEYWTISAEDSSGNPVANGFNASLTLPHNIGSPVRLKACRYVGTPGSGWECGTDAENSHTATTVTRNNIESFSDWAVGENVAPNLVTLRGLQATPGAASGNLLGVVGALLAGLVGVAVSRRRR